MKYFIADEHLGHQRVLEFCKETRKFATIEEHDKHMIDCHNRTVLNDDDDVYHLGDWAFYRSRKKLGELFFSLKGRQHLIYGNHDDKEVRELPWASQQDYLRLQHNNHTFILFHYPMVRGNWDAAHHGSCMIYGHVHNKPQYPYGTRALDVGVDSIGFNPISGDEIINRLGKFPKTIPEGFSGNVRRETT